MSKDFDPNGLGKMGNLFGLPYSVEEVDLVILPLPWEVTVSYHEGTARGPQAILDASIQIDLHHHHIKEAWKNKVALFPVSKDIENESNKLRELVRGYLTLLESTTDLDSVRLVPAKVNDACENLNIFIKNKCSTLLKEGKLIGLVGGDHSTPLGLLRALAEKHDRFGILQIDAHADLRKAYEDFTYSHGSIMYNALKLPAIARLVQVGVRDYCEEEVSVMNRSVGRVKTFFDEDLKSDLFQSKSWKEICSEIVKELPPLVYISFDIDGLDPKLCPATGTPVPGGLDFMQATYLIKEVVKSGRKIIGFDLCEVCPGMNEWDENVGARMLWELSQWTLTSNR
ncbi:MAG: agmatinase family protein [Cyclobacteriaceae bacterium]|nr:agmatinase family protein [Cyclobacteriaceae bacterium]